MMPTATKSSRGWPGRVAGRLDGATSSTCDPGIEPAMELGDDGPNGSSTDRQRVRFPDSGYGTLVQFHSPSTRERLRREGGSMRRGRVFVVDDDASVRRALHRLLQAAGFEVESYPDAAAYLERPVPPPPACLVLDIRMPGMTGLEFQRAIVGTHRELPVIFITGHGGEEMRAQGLGAGAVAVLFKPIDEEALIGAIEKALESARN